MAAAGRWWPTPCARCARPPGRGVHQDLDDVAETIIREAGGIPSFLGYHGYPASICSSVNDRVVHGIPAADETLAPGDLVSIDAARSSTAGTATPRSPSASVP